MELFVNARCYSFDAVQRRFRAYDSLLVDAGRIVALGEHPAGTGARRIDLEGATLLPAFADCHVHLTDTGYFIGARDLASVRTYDDFAIAVSRLPNDGGVVFGGQYDDSGWRDGATADARPLERFHAGARTMVTRIDGHSCLVNRTTLAWLRLPPETAGIERNGDGEPTGKLVLDANWRAQAAFLTAMPLKARRDAERRAVEMALARGAVHLHAQLVGFERAAYAEEIASLKTLPAKIHPKVCEPDAALAMELGLPYVGGDVFLDGSLGSRTAALVHPYCDDPGSGALRFSDDEVLGYFSQAEALGIAAGVHAIGDAAIEQCVRVWERVLAGKPSPRGCRHFIEHFELATQEQIEACARMGIYLSMQPQFDALWGGDGGMYEVRLGTERKRSMNALARIARAGGVLCGGDDSPVCALDPLAGMQACVDHHEPGERFDAHQALAMYTVDAARLGYAESETGNLVLGLAADFVVLDRDPLDGARFHDCRVLQTWIDGERVRSMAEI
ncbi:MAG: amidohydrolase family protein [Candidatus Eremiobacteraeota bacterium]|nr:amidohydrolase family protein [Candidatus Eremiobacteraeota bacterium]